MQPRITCYLAHKMAVRLLKSIMLYAKKFNHWDAVNVSVIVNFHYYVLAISEILFIVHGSRWIFFNIYCVKKYYVAIVVCFVFRHFFITLFISADTSEEAYCTSYLVFGIVSQAFFIVMTQLSTLFTPCSIAI